MRPRPQAGVVRLVVDLVRPAGDPALVVGLDVKDWEKQLTILNRTTRTLEVLPPKNCDYVEIGFAEVGISKWAMDYCRMWPTSVRALGDTALGVPELTRICGERIAKDPKLQKKIADRKAAIGRRHDQVWAKWQEEARDNWDASPMTVPRLSHEIWEVIKDHDWVLTANNLKNQVNYSCPANQCGPTVIAPFGSPKMHVGGIVVS